MFHAAIDRKRAFLEEAPDEFCGGAAILCAPPEEFVPEAGIYANFAAEPLALRFSGWRRSR